jgi:hypothetical protein
VSNKREWTSVDLTRFLRRQVAQEFVGGSGPMPLQRLQNARTRRTGIGKITASRDGRTPAVAAATRRARLSCQCSARPRALAVHALNRWRRPPAGRFRKAVRAASEVYRDGEMS